MSKIGMKHLAKNNPAYGGLAFGKGGLTSSYSPLWSPDGAYSYGDGGAYMVGSNTTALAGYGSTEDPAASASAAAAAQPAQGGLMEYLKNPVVLVILGIGGYMIYKNTQSPAKKKASNPRRRRKNTRRKRNGTKKGMARKGARRGARLAYDALPKKKRKSTKRRRNTSSYQKFVGKQMKNGKSMKQAASMWRRNKKR